MSLLYKHGSRDITMKDFLARLGACSEVVEWVGSQSLEQAWEACPYPEWLMRLCTKMADKPTWPSHRSVVMAGCACARTALNLIPQYETVPLGTIETTESWARCEWAALADVGIACDRMVSAYHKEIRYGPPDTRAAIRAVLAAAQGAYCCSSVNDVAWHVVYAVGYKEPYSYTFEVARHLCEIIRELLTPGRMDV